MLSIKHCKFCNHSKFDGNNYFCLLTNDIILAEDMDSECHHFKPIHDNNDLIEEPSSELEKVYNECSFPNWDGYEAVRVERQTLKNVESFISLLPENARQPEFGADPDGDITLEWRDLSQELSISISCDGTIAFSYRDGISPFGGTSNYIDKIPDDILEHILLFKKEKNNV